MYFLFLYIHNSFLLDSFLPPFFFLTRFFLTALTIGHLTRNRNDPISRAELYQRSNIAPSFVCMKESDAYSILFLPYLAREVKVNHRTHTLR